MPSKKKQPVLPSLEQMHLHGGICGYAGAFVIGTFFRQLGRRRLNEENGIAYKAIPFLKLYCF